MPLLWKKAPSAEEAALAEERRLLLEDVRRAQQEWEMANWRFHEAIGHDQTDYAIYSLEAAEQKFDMLLRKAKGIWSIGPDTKRANGEERASV